MTAADLFDLLVYTTFFLTIVALLVGVSKKLRLPDWMVAIIFGIYLASGITVMLQTLGLRIDFEIGRLPTFRILDFEHEIDQEFLLYSVLILFCLTLPLAGFWLGRGLRTFRK